MNNPPKHQIRAVYNDQTIRVYQAYNKRIATTAVANGTFVSPPFKMERMTWIKPSFLWMMYRCGWGLKDSGQTNILAIDIKISGLKWAFENSISSHRPSDMNKESWELIKAKKPVRIQWDPERDLHHNPLGHRSIQIGLKDEAMKRYVNDWIVNIQDITPLVSDIHKLLKRDDFTTIQDMLPQERVFNCELPSIN